MDLFARTIGNAAGLWLAVKLLSGMSVPGAPTTLAMIANLLVVGLVLDVLRSLGARLDVETTIARTAARIENSRGDTAADDAASTTGEQVSR